MSLPRSCTHPRRPRRLHKLDAILLSFFGRRFEPRVRGAPPPGDAALAPGKTQAGPTPLAQRRRLEEAHNLQALTPLAVPEADMRPHHVPWTRMRLLTEYTARHAARCSPGRPTSERARTDRAFAGRRSQLDVKCLLLAARDTMLLAGSADGALRACAPPRPLTLGRMCR